ncbi:MAG: excinuclease ABC subunit C [Bacteroidetes bacterium]|nr:excinuclease ABC subunit C [Bacteroidota bacterium]
MSLQTDIAALPNTPGVYKYFDLNDVIIYIGKAKNLKKRVNSYFTKKQYDSAKTKVLVSKIKRIEFTVVDSEMEALLLENTLIKEHQPKYNINLKDDKSFPLIRITNEPFPKVFPMRNPKQDGSQFFGPYTSARAMHTVVDLIKSLYPLRNCNLNLTQENIKAGKFKACLEYQIGNCNAPCIGLESEEEYMHSIMRVKEILRGDLREVREELVSRMMKESDELNFEEAARLKEKLDMLDHFKSKSTVVSTRFKDVEVFAITQDVDRAYVSYLKINHGMVIRTKSVEYKKKLNEDPADILQDAVITLRKLYASESREIILPVKIDLPLSDVQVTIPKSGDKKKLLDLALKNALFYKKQKLDSYAKVDPAGRTDRLMRQMMEDLRLTVEPRHIECFDNSNIQGTSAVSACVVFKDGKPSKADYRHFIIRTVEGPDDFASMREVTQRRYSRLLRENQPLPDLIVIDGGKGQLSSVVSVLKDLGIYGKVAVLGIAKRLEELFYPDDPLPLFIDKTSETLKVLQHMRDEAHRFGITHHRKRRSKSTLKTELSDIPGIGEKSANQLLKKFRSVKVIQEKTVADLIPVIGADKAEKVYQYFHHDIPKED